MKQEKKPSFSLLCLKFHIRNLNENLFVAFLHIEFVGCEIVGFTDLNESSHLFLFVYLFLFSL